MVPKLLYVERNLIIINVIAEAKLFQDKFKLLKRKETLGSVPNMFMLVVGNFLLYYLFETWLRS